MGNIIAAVPDGLTSEELVLNHIKYSIVIGVGLFLICFPFYRSRKSWWDAIAGRKLIKVLRVFILAEIITLLVLVSFYVNYGSPLELNQQLSYGNGDSWIFGYGRPMFGLLFISFGAFAEMHPMPRFICLFACLAQIYGDSLSAVQVGDYITQVRRQGAPTHGYSQRTLVDYYWRDLVSIALCSHILMLTALLICIVGVCDPPFYRYSEISAEEFDRVSVMRGHLQRRKMIEIQEAQHRQKQQHLLLAQQHLQQAAGGGGGGRNGRQLDSTTVDRGVADGENGRSAGVVAIASAKSAGDVRGSDIENFTGNHRQPN